MAANSYINSTLIAPDAHTYFTFHNVALREVAKDYQKTFTDKDYKTGGTVQVRLENRAIVQRGDAVNANGITEREVPLTIKPLYSVAYPITPTDLQRNIVDFNKQFTEPAMREIAADLNKDIYDDARLETYMTTGDAASYIDSFKDSALDKGLMETMGVPEDDTWFQVMSSNNGIELQSSVSNNFNQMVTEDVLSKGALGNLGAFDIFTDQTLPVHNTFVGAIGTPLVNGDVVSGATIVADGFTASKTGILKAGDVVRFSGVNSVSNIGRIDTGRPFEAVVAADADSDSGGNVTFTIKNAVISSLTSELRNVTGKVPDGATITVVGQTAGSYMCNFAYRRKGLIVVSPNLPEFPDLDSKTVSEDGLSIRVSIQSDLLNNSQAVRYDLQAAYRTMPEWVVKHISDI